jgi:hypothetical protein
LKLSVFYPDRRLSITSRHWNIIIHTERIEAKMREQMSWKGDLLLGYLNSFPLYSGIVSNNVVVENNPYTAIAFQKRWIKRLIAKRDPLKVQRAIAILLAHEIRHVYQEGSDPLRCARATRSYSLVMGLLGIHIPLIAGLTIFDLLVILLPIFPRWLLLLSVGLRVGMLVNLAIYWLFWNERDARKYERKHWRDWIDCIEIVR